MSKPIEQDTERGWWDEFEEFTTSDPDDLTSWAYEWEVWARRVKQLAQPRAIGTSSVAELVTHMEQMAAGGSFEKDLRNVGKATTQLTQQNYQHDHHQESKLTEDEIKALSGFSKPDLGYDPLSTNLTPEQEALEATRTKDAASDIFGPAVMGGDSSDDGHGFYSAPTNGLEMYPDFNITDGEFNGLLDSSFGKNSEQRSMVTEGSKSKEQQQKRPEMSTEVSQAQATLQQPSSTCSKVSSFENTGGREVVPHQMRKDQAQRRKGNKTAKKVFEAGARSQNPASPLNTASPVPRSAHWSWGNSSTHRPIAPRPSSQSSVEDTFNTSRRAQASTPQGLPSRPDPRGHQRQRSNQSNLFFAGPVQPSSGQAYGAGSPQRKQGYQPPANLFASLRATSSFEVPRTPIHPRFSQTPHSSRRANMSPQNTPTQTPVTPTTPTPRGLASLPRRPPGPLPNFNGPPIRQPNFGPQSPAPTNAREFAGITFPTRIERDEGIELLKGAGSKEEDRYKLWRESHPRFKEMKVYWDLDPESMTVELYGPIGSNVRGALSSLFEGRYQVSARLG
jgi:hypothetical protein